MANRSNFLKDRISALEKEVTKLRKLVLPHLHKNEMTSHFDENNQNETVFVIDRNFSLLNIANNKSRKASIKENAIGKKCYSVFYGFDDVCEECTVKKAIQRKESNYFFRSYLKDNKLQFEENHVIPLINESSEVEKLIVLSKDISSYCDLVNKAGEKEELYKRIFNSAGDAFLVHDDEGRLIEFSSRLPEILGYSSKELEDLNVKDIDNPDFSMPFKNRTKQIEKLGTVVFETNLKTKKGGLIPVEVSANLTNFSNTKLFFVAIRNIEKRKIAEQRLTESEERFRTLVENAPDLIMRFDKEYRHLFVNSASKSILNIAPEKFIGKTHEEMGFPSNMCRFWEQQMKQVFSRSKPHTVEFSFEIEGELRYFEWQLIPEFNSDGKHTTLMAVARDITAQKLSERALNEAIQTKDKFFSIIAHDLKNPFNALLGISKSLKENCDQMTSFQIKEAASIINSSAKQEYNLLKNLLEWSMSQMGKINKSPQNINLLELIESNIQLFENQSIKKRISVSVLTGENIVVYADKYMIDTVIRNLFSNALKFSNPGGKIIVKAHKSQENVFFEVEDKGVGISLENQEKLFCIDTNYTRVGTCDETGTGLGLILCKEFVEQNKGKISVESKLGKGSRFVVQLPLGN